MQDKRCHKINSPLEGEKQKRGLGEIARDGASQGRLRSRGLPGGEGSGCCGSNVRKSLLRGPGRQGEIRECKGWGQERRSSEAGEAERKGLQGDEDGDGDVPCGHGEQQHPEVLPHHRDVVSRHGGDGLTVGPDELRGLSQLSRSYDSSAQTDF